MWNIKNLVWENGDGDKVPVLGQVLPAEDVEKQREPDLPGRKVQNIGDGRECTPKTIGSTKGMSSKTAKKEKFHITDPEI